MRSGWIKLHIKTIDNQIWQKDNFAWKVFEYLVMRSYPIGRVVTSRQQIAEATFGNSSTVYKALTRLRKAKMVTTSVTTKYTTIYICNWEKYQQDGNNFGNNKVTTKEQQSNTLNKNIDIRIKNKDNTYRSFEEFWQQYPRKVNKKGAMKSWERINPDLPLKEKILNSLRLQRLTPQWQRDDGKFIPHPATWLNQERWNDEVNIKKQVKVNIF